MRDDQKNIDDEFSDQTEFVSLDEQRNPAQRRISR